MSLSPHKQHKIYIAARMGFGISSEDPEELAYYDMVNKETSDSQKRISLGINRTDF